MMCDNMLSINILYLYQWFLKLYSPLIIRNIWIKICPNKKVTYTTKIHILNPYKTAPLPQAKQFFYSDFKKHFRNHFNILINIGRYATNIRVKSTKIFVREEEYINYFFHIQHREVLYDSKPIFFLTTPFQNTLQIKTIVKKVNMVTIQVSPRYFISRQVTVPFWIPVFNMWVEYSYVNIYYKSQLLVQWLRYEILNQSFKAMLQF